MKNWRERLEEKGTLIADGAWGTQLASRGLPPGMPPERWNLENPDAVREVAAAYVDAGADIILSNSFGGTNIKLERAGLGDRVAEVNRAAARLSREAAGDRTLVFASVGPTGEFLEPVGSLTEAQLVPVFEQQIRALVEGGANGIVIETMSDLGEARCALRAARAVCDLPVAVTMTFERKRAGMVTMMGIGPEQAGQALAEAGADIIGANCGAGIADMIEVARALAAVPNAIVWAKPNAGLPELVGGRTVFRETPDAMAARYPDLVAVGARIVGGCCGTTPEHIRALARALGR
ncbi:MAG: homocysteine S-methyltransferase family protein [Planctomycetes bacterium]|nr:homocysteine S-methyltransferase family protein [Planctomycetota bacterium]